MGNNIALEKEKAIEEIINRISSGESLRSILPYQNRSEHLPHIGTFLRWVSEDEKLSEHYARAMEIRADIMFEGIVVVVNAGISARTTTHLEFGNIRQRIVRIVRMQNVLPPRIAPP